MSFLRFLSFHARKSRLRAEESESDDEKDTLIAPYHERASSHKRSNRRKWELALMTLGTFSLLLHIVFFARQRYHTSDASSCFEPGWTSKVGPPFPTLSVEKVQFKAGLDLDIAGELVRTGNVNDALQYVGEPTDEMDANWEWLIPSDTNITREEAQQIGGEFYFYPGTDIATVEISSFHILHCLDQIRQSIYPYYTRYWPNGVDKLQQVHVDHCIDVIRQYIQCHVDLTPINLAWSKNKNGILPDFKQTHTCRSFREAHEWVLRRNIANYENGIGDKGVADDAQRTLKKFGWA